MIDEISKTQQRVIRVFISSTFRDMHAERDRLAKFIFPQLRRLCESRSVTWGEVDLRWGVTDEEASEGKILPICLEEINRCRPYFIGLLGERYGWVPESISEDLLEKEKWLREGFEGCRSVTELEILHGVLRNPAMAVHAYFYLRDPAFVSLIPEKDRKDFLSENDEASEKLNRLKQLIRTSGFPVRENYPNPKALGELVLADLTRIINQCWPEGSQPDSLTCEVLDHAAYAHSRRQVYIERPEYFARLDAHAAGNCGQPLVILGESGSGKSALLANWTARYRRAHLDAFVIEHYISATPASADWIAILRRIMGEFKRRLDLRGDIPEHPDALRNAFPNWLHMAAAERRIILALDALNQLEDRDSAPDLPWLPPVMPENVCLIVSTLPGRALDEITRRRWPVFEIELLTVEERRQLLNQFLRDYGRTLSPARVDRIVNAQQSANPLYLRVLLNELRLFGRYERLEERISHYLQAASPYELYEKVIIRWEKDYEGNTDLVGDTLSLLWAARRGLSESELLDALGHNGQPLPRATWAPLFLAMADSLVSRSGLLTFAHDFLRAAARDAYLPSESHQRRAHSKLADYFAHQSAGSRRIDELPWQLAEAHAWQRLYDLLADHEFFKNAYTIRSQFELKTYWTQIEDNSSLRIVDAYRTQIDRPGTEPDKVFLNYLEALLADTGHPEAALCIGSELINFFRNTGDLRNLQVILGNQAWRLLAKGDIDGALALNNEKENICRQLGDLDSLQTSFGIYARISYDRGDLDGAMEQIKKKESICRQLGNLSGLSLSLSEKAQILAKRGNLDEAMALNKENENICRQSGDLNGLLCSLGNQALILKDKGDLSGAMALFKEVERICRQLGNQSLLSCTLGDRALILKAQGNLDAAMALHKEEEQICRKLGDLNGLQTSLGNQAKILFARGNIDDAMALHKEEERICRQLGNLDGLSRTLGNQAIILFARGSIDEAMTLHKEEERICRQLGNLAGLQTSLGNQARILFARGHIDEAMTLHKQKERICRQLGDLAGLQESLGSQAHIFHERGDLEGALALYKEKEDICRRLGNLDGLQCAIGDQALALKDLGDIDGATVLLKEQERICRQLGNLDSLQVCLGNQAGVLAARGNLVVVMALYKEKERICRQLGNVEGLAQSLGNQGMILKIMNRAREGLLLAEEAYQLAAQHGYTKLTRQIERILNSIRRATRGY
jgi:nephrocystin-3